MIRTMHTATNTLGQLQQHLDIIGNNVANVDTHGYKSQQANFREMLFQQHLNDKLDRAPRESAPGIRYGVGAKIGQAKTNETTGSLQTTDRSLDFALTNPRQYFVIRHESMKAGDPLTRTEDVYTRKGNFYLVPNGNNTSTIVDEEGRSVLGANGADMIIRDGVKSLDLSPSGELVVSYDDGTTDELQFAVYEIDRPDFMRRLPNGNIALPENIAEMGVLPNEILRPVEQNGIHLQQGALERSNVRLEDEMTELISTQRLYQMNARTVTLADQMLGIVNNIR